MWHFPTLWHSQRNLSVDFLAELLDAVRSIANASTDTSLLSTSPLSYLPCLRPLSHTLFANVTSLPIAVLNAHIFDTYSLAVSVPLALLESAAYIFICASTSMLILSKSIYIINAYFIKPIFQLSPIPPTFMIPPVFSPCDIC